MQKKAQLSVFLLVLGCHAERPVPQVNDEPTLAILGEDGVICAAVALTPTLAVTANHCVPGHDVTFVTASQRGQAERTAFGSVLWRESSSDLALFASDGLVPATLAPGSVDYEHATTVITHIPAPWSVAKLRPTDSHEGFLHTARLESGMSGSGLWDDGGRLVGIAVGNDQTSGYFAGRERIEQLLSHAPGPAARDAPSHAKPALWGDPQLAVDDLLLSARQHRLRIEAGLDQLGRGR